MGSENTYTLKNGRVLHLRAVKSPALRHILMQFGPQALTDPDSLMRLDAKRKIQAVQATEQLFGYCAGWGVEDDPPADALAELESLGVDTHLPRLARTQWLRFLELEDDGEAGELLAAVMTLTYQEEEKEEPKLESDTSGVDALKEQLVTMQAELEELKGSK